MNTTLKIAVSRKEKLPIIDEFMEKEWKTSNIKVFGREMPPEEWNQPLNLLAWDEESELVGVAKCIIIGNTVRVHQLLTRTDLRGKAKIGTSLLNKVVELCKENNWHKIRLSTSDKHGVLPFYLKNGFKIEATLENDAFGFTWYILSKYPLRQSHDKL